jgi:hypothetical protein
MTLIVTATSSASGWLRRCTSPRAKFIVFGNPGGGHPKRCRHHLYQRVFYLLNCRADPAYFAARLDPVKALRYE